MDNQVSSIRNLPNGKPISSLGFGCSSLWAKKTFPEDDSFELLGKALLNGINHFDTAPSYGCGERRLGKFLKHQNRRSLVISSKVGTEYSTQNRSFDPSRMRRSLEGSLERLGIDRLDILYLHGPSKDDLNDNTFSFLEELKRERLITYSGVNSFDPSVVAAVAGSQIDAVMLQYSLADRRFDALIDKLAANGQVVIAGTILAQSIFDRRTFNIWESGGLWYTLRAFKNDPTFMLRGRELAKRIDATGLSPHAAAIQFCISNQKITSNLFGTRNKEHLLANIRASRVTLDEKTLKILSKTSARTFK